MSGGKAPDLTAQKLKRKRTFVQCPALPTKLVELCENIGSTKCGNECELRTIVNHNDDQLTRSRLYHHVFQSERIRSRLPRNANRQMPKLNPQAVIMMAVVRPDRSIITPTAKVPTVDSPQNAV